MCTTTSAQKGRSVTLQVTVLETPHGLNDDPAPTYPATITIDVPSGLQMAAYGAAYYVWLGPPSWTGQSAVGADGSEFVSLFPMNGSATSGPRIVESAEIGCTGCKTSDAAPYFQDALRDYNREAISDGILQFELPKGLVVRRVSWRLSTFSFPNERDLRVRGAAFWDHSVDGPFQDITLALPARDQLLADFLLKDFATRIVERFAHK